MLLCHCYYVAFMFLCTNTHSSLQQHCDLPILLDMFMPTCHVIPGVMTMLMQSLWFKKSLWLFPEQIENAVTLLQLY